MTPMSEEQYNRLRAEFAQLLGEYVAALRGRDHIPQGRYTDEYSAQEKALLLKPMSAYGKLEHWVMDSR